MMRRMPAARCSRTDPVLLAILAVALLLFLLGIQWGLPNTHAWNGDDISPDKPLRVVWNWLFGWHKYPYLHWWISFALYSPYLAWLALRGELDASCFPRFESECFSEPVAQLTVLMGLSRLLSVAMALGVVGLTVAVARLLGQTRSSVLAVAAAAACSPVLVFFAHTGNLDVPQTFWFSAWLLFFVRIVRGGGTADHLGFGLAVGAAVSTKEGIGGAFVLPSLAVYVLHLRRASSGASATPVALLRASLDRRLLLLAASAVGVYIVIQNPFFNAEGFARHLEAWNPAGERMTSFRTGFSGWGRFARDVARSVGEGAGPLLAGLGALGAVLAVVRLRPAAWLLLPALSYVGVSLLTARFAPVRFALPLVPLLAVFLGELLAAARHGPRAAAPLALGAVAVALGQALALSVNLDLFLLNDSRYLAEAWLREHADPSQRVAVFAPARYLPRADQLGQELWEVPETKWSAEGLSASGAAWIVLSDRYHPRFRGERGEFFAALKAGQLGWTVAWEGRGTTPLEPWLGGPGLVGAINPYFTILGQSGPAGERLEPAASRR
jgi:hypothetical protein